MQAKWPWWMICALCLQIGQVLAQRVNYDLVVPPGEVRPKTFEEYLVQLAWQNTAANRVVELRKQIEEEAQAVTVRSWTRDVQASFNLNEVSLANILQSPANADNNIVIYPLYQFSISLPLSTLVLLPRERRMADLKVKVAQAQIDQQKLQVRAEVLRRYQQYQLAVQVLEARALAEADAEATYKLVKKMFERRTGEVGFEDVNAASTHYYQAREARLNAEADVTLARIDLEEMIGISWDLAQRWKERLR